MWRLAQVLKLAPVVAWAQTESWPDAGPVVGILPVMPSFRASSVAPFVPSPRVAGKNHTSCILHCHVVLF